MSEGIVIAGGGLAAQRAAETLRRGGYEGRVRMICGEPHRPYDRPPLSKAVLAGADDDLGLRPAAWYDDHGVELLLGRPAARLDCTARAVTLAGGDVLRYDRLLIATGSHPRRLPLLDGFANVHTLRTIDDARALRAALVSGGRLAVVGAGLIGQEVAAAAARAGMHVTIVETAAAPLEAVIGAEVGGWFADLHRSQGVEVLLGAQIVGLEAAERREAAAPRYPAALGDGAEPHDAAAPGARARIAALTLHDGCRLPCDHVVVGIGVAPALGWLVGSGLDPRGVPIDAAGRTPAPDVFAAGDAAATYDPVVRRHVPGGHWESAARQGAAAAGTMLGHEPQRSAPASFWSDLYDTRVQYLGNARLADRTAVDGDPAGRDFTITFTSAGTPVAVLLVGRPHELPRARALLAA
jgi:3-phenylpropionate/trans-cinnamate dioxygenase ferredoxin reductase subunit